MALCAELLLDDFAQLSYLLDSVVFTYSVCKAILAIFGSDLGEL